MDYTTELQKRNILRQNNAESNAITRECIESALIQLMEDKTFEQISITDITKKAGVSRNAYYRNYNSKEDILSKYLQNILSHMSGALKQYDPITQTKQAWVALLKVTEKFSPQYKLILKAGYGERLKMEFQKEMNQNITPGQHALYYSNCYWVGALCNILAEWVNNDMEVPIDELADIGSTLMVHGIQTINLYGNSCD
ncbi:MAG: TetR/AcrR family transcriptional regulator [bacterium]|nr:TetR/AcrR family transcriptional regulator [bacterium]